MEIKEFQLGLLSTNAYIVYENGEGYLIDIGSERVNEIIKFLEDKKIELKGVLFTHGHFDHIAGLDSLLKKYPELDVYIGREDAGCLSDPYLNLSNAFGSSGISYKVKEGKLKLLKDGDKVWKFTVIETPGHTQGSISFYSAEDKKIFSGDLIFYESYGRTDFPGGDFISLIDSIRMVVSLGDDITIYTGHYKETNTTEFREWFDNSMKGDF